MKNGWGEPDQPRVGEATEKDWKRDRKDREEVRQLVRERNKKLPKVITRSEWDRRFTLNLVLDEFVPYDEWIRARQSERRQAAVSRQEERRREDGFQPPLITPEQSKLLYTAYQRQFESLEHLEGGYLEAVKRVAREMAINRPIEFVDGVIQLQRLKESVIRTA